MPAASASGGAGRSLPALDRDAARVAIVIPIRNEVRSIARTLDCVLNQTFPAEQTEVFVADGLSDDGTREIVQEYAARHPRVHLLNNPKRTIPVALNLAIAASNAGVIVRVDGRCHIAPDYVETCVDLLAATGAANVGGLMRPEGNSTVGRAVAIATKSRFGVGNGRFHYLERQEWVDTVYLGCFRREVLEEVGGYDEELIRNQDDELNYRIRAAGYGILLSPAIRSTYIPAATLRKLWRSQYYQYGYWKVRVIQKHPGSLQPKHLAPPALVAVLISSAVLFVLTRRKLMLFPIAGYLAGTGLAALWMSRHRPRLLPVVAAVFACMHVGYGTGFLRALVRLLLSHAGRMRRSGTATGTMRSSAGARPGTRL